MKDEYRNLCEIEPSIPLFSQAWWLDAVAGENWDVVVAKKGNQIVGALPYLKRRRLVFTILAQPEMTQSLGPWIRPTNKSYPKQLAYEKDILGDLADALPAYDFYSQSWHCGSGNWLPFYWRGFEQTTRYTYRLANIGDHENLWKGLQQNIRGDIRKARERYQLEVRAAKDLDEYIALDRLTYERQGKVPPYSRDFLASIDNSATARNARDCLVAVDPEGRPHAGAYIVRHGDTAYYLMGGGDPELRSSGATSLVLWEAICRQPDDVNIFDFEGSMIEPIERFFRAFGAVQTPYFEVAHSRSRLFSMIKMVRSLIQ